VGSGQREKRRAPSIPSENLWPAGPLLRSTQWTRDRATTGPLCYSKLARRKATTGPGNQLTRMPASVEDEDREWRPSSLACSRFNGQISDLQLSTDFLEQKNGIQIFVKNTVF